MPLMVLCSVPSVSKLLKSLLDEVGAPVTQRVPPAPGQQAQRPAAPQLPEPQAGTVIDLRPDHIQELAHVTAAAAGRSGTPFGTYIFRPAEPGADLARHVEAQVFDEAFGYSPDTTNAEYGPYEGSTVFVCVLDHRRSLPVGAIRLVLPSGAGFKSLHDTARAWGREVDVASNGINLDTEQMWDIATLSVDPRYRNGLVSSALYQATCTIARRNGVRWFVTVIDVAVLRLLQLALRKPFTPFTGFEPRDCVGSLSLPCFSDVPTWAAHLAKRDPTLHETLFQGNGLEAVVSHPDWHQAAQLVTRVPADHPPATQLILRSALRPVA